MLTSWILSIILIDAYLIVVEYAREAYAMQLGVSAMSADVLRGGLLRPGIDGVPVHYLRHRSRLGKNWAICARACSGVSSGLARTIMGVQKSIISSMVISPVKAPS